MVEGNVPSHTAQGAAHPALGISKVSASNFQKQNLDEKIENTRSRRSVSSGSLA